MSDSDGLYADMYNATRIERDALAAELARERERTKLLARDAYCPKCQGKGGHYLACTYGFAVSSSADTQERE